jgi:cell division inhibitor SepF
MSLGQSLRAAVRQFGGASDDYDEYDDYADDEEFAAPQDSARSEDAPRREWGARPLAVVRPPSIEFSLVAPQDFEAAQQIADFLRADHPVIVDLQRCGPDLSKRLIDFCSGLTYALEGGLQYIGEKVVLLEPPHVDLSSDAPGELRERRFFNQV